MAINFHSKQVFKKFLPGIVLILVIGLVFLAGFYSGQRKSSLSKIDSHVLAYSEEAKNFSKTIQAEETFDANMYFEVWDTLKRDYVDKNKIKDKDLFYGSLKGLAQAVNDPYTVFMDPKTSQEFTDDLAGTFEGIGAEVGMRNEIITIIAPLDGMPAQKAGILAGDKVYAIDGQPTMGMTVDEAVKKIRGPKDTQVTLTVLRGAGDSAQEIKITRGVIVVKSLKTEMRSDGIYVIKISSFNDDTLTLFNKAVDEIVNKKPKGVILDLRNNPGGYLETSVILASEWIEAGPVVAEQFGENRRNEYPASGLARLKDTPTVVLINGGSASASEIVAGALRDYKKATLVGEQTFGKGSVQTLRSLSDGSSIKITIAKWLTPAGDFINEKGIAPDVKVDLTIDEINKNLDPQLNKALEILKKPTKK